MGDTVLLAHGSGGSMMRELIEGLFFDAYGSAELLRGDDAAILETLAAGGADAGRLALSTDTFVVSPYFFPGGDIGRLAVCGTVNDVATSGAVPLWLSVGFILEEGLPLADLRGICASMAAAAREAGVRIVTGDTKVVERGHGDGIYINTTGVGLFAPALGYADSGHRGTRRALSGADCQPGDRVLLSGTLGDHGIAIVSARENLGFTSTIESDVAPLNHLVADVLDLAPHTRCFRDPTRGGLASTLNELAMQSQVAIIVEEEAVPVHDAVRGACEMLGYDIFQVANEGKMVAVVPAQEAEAALCAMRASRYGKDAALIGEVAAIEGGAVDGVSAASAVGSVGAAGAAGGDGGGAVGAVGATGGDGGGGGRRTDRAYAGAEPLVTVRTAFGSQRVLDMLVGEQLPRIC
ncbi:MAG: hydrogenase expression/formation protein HypE [Coriobacteriales bacterium]|nr:hydrogenase expression/formation protein HypE [Coriobacteriales bacterium]